MKNSAKQWLTTRAASPGVLACGMRLPNGKFVCHSVEGICPVPTAEKILRQFEGLRPTLAASGFSPRWSTWAFEQGQIRFVERADGWLLGLVVRADSDIQPLLDPLSAEFLTVEFD